MEMLLTLPEYNKVICVKEVVAITLRAVVSSNNESHADVFLLLNMTHDSFLMFGCCRVTSLHAAAGKCLVKLKQLHSVMSSNCINTYQIILLFMLHLS